MKLDDQQKEIAALKKKVGESAEASKKHEVEIEKLKKQADETNAPLLIAHPWQRDPKAHPQLHDNWCLSQNTNSDLNGVDLATLFC